MIIQKRKDIDNGDGQGIQMNKNQIHIADLFNRFESNISKLIFTEAALRGMIQTGIIEEPKVSEGISCVFNAIIQEYELINDQLQDSKRIS